jgi:hypothetical protein
MCTFFSFCTDEKGNKYYFNDEQRKTICKTHHYSPDSHTSIADYYEFKGRKEDLLNKYEYDPIQHDLKEDTIIFEEDYDKVLEWCKSLDFYNIDQKAAKGLEIVKQYEGKRFRVKSSCEEPSYNWGRINRNSIGTIIGFDKSDNILIFSFPEQPKWYGILEEMEEVFD